MVHGKHFDISQHENGLNHNINDDALVSESWYFACLAMVDWNTSISEPTAVTVFLPLFLTHACSQTQML